MGQANLFNQELKEFNINEVIQSYYVYAKDNINAGDFVEFVNGVASKTTTATEGKDLSTLSYSGRDTKAALLKNGNIFIVFTSGTDEDVLNYMVVSSDGVNLTPHTSVQVGTSRGYHSRPIVLDNGKVFFTYGSGSKSYLYGCLVAINGTVPSTVATIGIDTSDSYTGRGSSAVGLGNNRIFVTRTYEGRYASGVVITATDTTLTKGTEVALHPDWESPNYEKDCCVLTSGKVFVAWSNNTGEFLLGTVCTVSGTTVTPLTVDPVEIVSTGSIADDQYAGESFSITALSEERVYITHSYTENFFRMAMTVCKVSGTTITPGTDVRIGNDCRSLDQVLLPDGNIFVAHSGTGDFNLMGAVIKVSGTTPSLLKDVELDGADSCVGDVSTILDKNNNIFISHTDPNDHDYLHGQIFSIIDNTPTPTVITSVYEKQVKKATVNGFINGIARSNGSGGSDTAHNQQVEVGVIGNLFNTTDKSWSLSGVAIKVTNNVMTVTGTCTGATGKVTLADNLNLPTGNYRVHFKGACSGTFEIINKAGTIMYWGAGDKVYVVEGKDINKLVWYTQTTGAHNSTVEFAIYKDDDLEDRNNTCYLESSGTQYIDTGVVSTADTRVEIDFQFTQKPSSSATAGIIGGWGTPTSSGILFGATDYNYFSFAYGSTWNGKRKDIDFLRHKVIIDNTIKSATLDGNKLAGESDITASIVSTINMYLFRSNGGANYATARIFYCKVWQGGSLVRDFVPAINDKGVPCMYDKVSKTYFLNKGSGSFKFGTTKQPYEYLESTGTQYIDSEIVPNSKTRMEIRFKLNKIDVSQGIGWGSSAYQECFNIAFNPTYGFRTGVSSSYQLNYAKDTLDTEIHTFDIKSGSQKFDGVEYAKDTIGDTAETGQTLYLFSHHAEWTTEIDGPCYMNLYLCRIYDGDTLVRDFVPANPNGTPCLYDKISKRYFYNKGTGNFVIK